MCDFLKFIIKIRITELNVSLAKWIIKRLLYLCLIVELSSYVKTDASLWQDSETRSDDLKRGNINTCNGAACVVPFRMACGILGSGEVHYSCRLVRELTAAAGLGATHMSGDTGPGGFGRHVGKRIIIQEPCSLKWNVNTNTSTISWRKFKTKRVDVSDTLKRIKVVPMKKTVL